MKRWMTHLGIGAYLFALFAGIVSHTFAVGQTVHPAMYFVVWDMFCGWAAYEGRMQVIAEGESGKFYQLAPGPWGDFCPYGRLGRHHYDSYSIHGARIAMNCLKHTRHEPMTRIFVVEENFAKKFNIPDDQYLAYYNKPKKPRSYYHTRFIITPDGETLRTQPPWLAYQYDIGLADNPRLVADARRTRPFMAIGVDGRAMGAYATGHYYEPPPSISVGAPLAE